MKFINLILRLMNQKKYLDLEVVRLRKMPSWSQKYPRIVKSQLGMRSPPLSKHAATYNAHKVIASSHNSTIKPQRNSQSTRKHQVKKFMLYELPQKKLKTDNSSLSCSTFKNLRISHSILRSDSKNLNHFPSVEVKKKTTKINNKTKRSTYSTDKNSFKTKNTNTPQPTQNACYRQLLGRTKGVLQGWEKEKGAWQQERQLYQLKIAELTNELNQVKQRVGLDKPQNSRFYSMLIQ